MHIISYNCPRNHIMPEGNGSSGNLYGQLYEILCIIFYMIPEAFGMILRAIYMGDYMKYSAHYLLQNTVYRKAKSWMTMTVDLTTS